MKRISLMIMLVCCITTYATAQTKEETLRKYIKEAQEEKADADYIKGMLKADSFAKAEHFPAGRGEVSNVLGGYYFTIDPDKSIQYLLKAHEYYLEAGNKAKATVSLQNVAFAFNDLKKDPQTALKYTLQSIAARTELNDTQELASMTKYAAMLYGKLGNFKESKRYAIMAINLYGMTENPMGVAASYRDLANVYDHEKKYDSSIFIYVKAKNTWQRAKGERSTIYEWNNAMMDLYVNLGDLQKAEALYHENDTASIKIYYTSRLHFYKSSAALFKKKKEKTLAKEYKMKYANFSDSLKKEGKHVDE